MTTETTRLDSVSQKTARFLCDLRDLLFKPSCHVTKAVTMHRRFEQKVKKAAKERKRLTRCGLA